jgi:hypothetical protein
MNNLSSFSNFRSYDEIDQQLRLLRAQRTLHEHQVKLHWYRAKEAVAPKKWLSWGIDEAKNYAIDEAKKWALTGLLGLLFNKIFSNKKGTSE